MKKVTFLVTSLGYGGVEKAITDLANALSANYKVNIVSSFKIYDTPIYELNKKINIEYLDENTKLDKDLYSNNSSLSFFANLKSKSYVKSIDKLEKTIIKKYLSNCETDIIITSKPFHNELISKFTSPNVIKIGWEHNHHDGKKNYFEKVCNSAKKLDYFVLVSKELTNDYKKVIGKSGCKCKFIPNMITNLDGEKSNLEEKNIVAVGKMTAEKGFFDLIDVFSLVVKCDPNANLNIIGSGVLYNKISSYVAKKKMQNNIILHGYQNNEYVHNVLSNSSLYVMTSFTESFGIVLLEAFSHGVPCLAFDSAKGAKEVINNGKDGFVIKGRNKEKMAKVILNLLENKKLRKDLGKEAIKNAKKYSSDVILPYWIELLENSK